MTQVKQPDMQLTMMMVNDTQTVSVSERNDCLTWMEVVDIFLQFLRGCGYQVEARDVVEYLEDAYLPQSDPATNTATITTPENMTTSPAGAELKGWWNIDPSAATRDVI